MKPVYRPVIAFTMGILTGVIAISLMAFRDQEQAKNDNVVMPYQWKVPQVPGQMEFAGEKVPLERWEIKEAFDRELLYNYYQQQNILYMLKLASRYFPMIEERLKANGVPEDFKYLCVAESNIQNLTSKVGAKGFWQFMPGTAPSYALEVSDDVDQRYDPRRSTDAACAYLKEAYRKFGSWTAAAASYNCGMGGFDSQAAYQGTNNYYDLMLPEETNRYIFRILTFKHLMNNASQMGYHLEKDDLYTPVTTKQVAVSKTITDLAAFAKANGTNYKMLKLLNPWLRSKKLTIRNGKTYYVDIPQ